MIPLSCFILTLNSERRLPEVLASIDGLIDDQVIIDSGSTDRTEVIVRKFGARFFYRKFDDFVEQKNYGARQCRYDWVLNLDSDEVVSKALFRRIADLKRKNFTGATPEVDAFGIYREWFMLGKRVHCFYPSRCPDSVIRIYRRDRALFSSERRIHEWIVGFTRAEIIHEPIYHYTCDSIEQLYRKMNLYSKLGAADLLLKDARPSYFRLIAYPWLIWCLWYIVRGGWKDGMIGVIHGRFVRDYVYLKYLMARYDSTTLLSKADTAIECTAAPVEAVPAAQHAAGIVLADSQ